MTTNIITAIISAYCACKLCCGPNAKGINASGKTPVQGQSIAVPRRYRLGSSVTIAGQTFRADDRLARRHDSRFDIYLRNHREAQKFGIKREKVTIITPSPVSN